MSFYFFRNAYGSRIFVFAIVGVEKQADKELDVLAELTDSNALIYAV